MFKKYYELPLKADDYCGTMVWCKNDMWAFNVLSGNRKSTERIIKCINGDSQEWINGSFKKSISDNCIIDFITNDDRCIPTLLCRGWDELTGIGGHNLSEKEAASIQDSFIEYCICCLNASNQ